MFQPKFVTLEFKKPRQINFAHCLSAMKSVIPLLLTRPFETLASLWQALSAFFKSNEPVRLGRTGILTNQKLM
jgi:hypothetical protein